MDNSMSISAADWSKGIGLSVAASIIGGTSKLAIRKSWLLQQAQKEETRNSSTIKESVAVSDNTQSLLTARARDKQRGIYTLRYGGMFGMSVLNPICCVLAMNYASPSILAPFSGLTLVWVIAFSGMFVGEKPSKSETVAAILIVFGEVLVAAFGDHTNDDSMTTYDVQESYTKPASISYFVALSIYVGVLIYWIRNSKGEVLLRFAWGSVGGAITGPQCFLKDSLIVLKTCTATDQPYPWFFAVLVFFAAATSFVGLLLLTGCMKRYDATYSAAAFVGSFVVSASINAAAHYNTFSALESALNYILYPVGLVVLMIGVFVLVNSEPPSVGSSSKSEDDSKISSSYLHIDDEDV